MRADASFSTDKRIAFVIASSVLGGHELQCAELVKLAKDLCRATVYLNRPEHERLFRGIEGLEVVIAEDSFFKAGKLPVQVLRGIHRSSLHRRRFAEYDRVIICAGAVEASLEPAIALLFTGKADLYLPFIYDRTSIYGWLGAPYTCLLRMLVNLFGAVITINRIQAKLISRFYRGRTFFVRNKIGVVEPAATAVAGRKLVTIGRLDRQKRVAELVNALDYADNPFKVLMVIGDGPLRREVQCAAERARHIRVEMVGWLDFHEQAQVLSRHDVLVLNSIIEGEPMVVREANARNMAVVVPDIDGMRGITSKANRFTGSSDLREKIAQAYRGALVIKRVYSESRLDGQRRRQFSCYLSGC